MNLNSNQRNAIEADAGAAINVVAGAGTGKTTVLVERYLKLVRDDGIAPDRLLALTFTLKAAAQMRERVHEEVAKTMPERAAEFHDAWIMNFHQFGLRLIKGNAPAFGIDPDVSVMSPADFHRVRGVLRRRFIEGRIEGMSHDFGGEPPTPAKLESRFELFLRAALDCRSDLIDLSHLRKCCTEDDHAAYVAHVDAIIAVGRAYEAELRRRNLIDFGDMIALPAGALKSDARLRALYVSRFDHILVDEFQDTSESQNELLKTLCGGEFKHVTVVGDAKQSIYRWRDARVENILNFEGDRYPLKINYRSRQNILDMANGLVAIDPDFESSRDAALEAHVEDSDRPIVLFHPQEGSSRADEATALAAWVLWLNGREVDGLPDPPDPALDFGDVTILLRKLKQSGGLPEIERAFESCKIPYSIVGGANAVEMWALEGLHAMFSLILPGDRVRELLSVLERDPFLVSDETLNELFVKVKSKPIGHDWLADEEISRVTNVEARGRMTLLRELIVEMREQMLAWDFRRFVTWGITESSLLRRLFASGLSWRAVDDLVGEVHEILDSMEQRGEMQLTAFLDNLRAAIDEKKFREEGDVRLPEGRVRIMTIHQSKGLEFPAVAVAGIGPPRAGDDRIFITKDKGIFFSWRDKVHWNRSFDDIASEKQDEERMEKQEERCVLYVALTRAERFLWVSSPHADGLKKGRRKDPERSLFCDVLTVAREGNIDTIELRAPVEAAPVTSQGAAGVSETGDELIEILAERNAARERLTASRVSQSADAIEFVNWAALATYASCPLQYEYRYRSRRAEVASPGSSVASVDEKGERFGGVKIPDGISPIDYGVLVHEALREAMDPANESSSDNQRILALVRKFGSKGAESDAIAAAMATLVAALRNSELGTAGDQLRLEEPFEVRLDRLVFHGIVDRVEKIDAGWRVTDYKVGLEDPAYDKQVASYVWAVEKITGEECTGQICYLRKDGVHVKTVAVTGGAFEKNARSLERSLASMEFPARPGKICEQCSFSGLCPSSALHLAPQE